MNKTTSMVMTGIILLILLLARFVYAFFLHYDRLTLEAAYLLLNYFLITLLIRINKPQLYLLNFDRNSMFFFVLLGITYAVLLYQSVGIFLFLMVVYNRDLLSQNVAFAKTESSLKSILLGVLGVLTLLIYFWAQPDALRFSGNVEIAGAILQANAPVVFFEEFIFRGVLWMALRKINLSERWILMTRRRFLALRIIIFILTIQFFFSLLYRFQVYYLGRWFIERNRFS